MIWRTIFLAVLCSVTLTTSVSAQSKFFGTSSRGAEGGKANAQIGTLQGENDRMNACTAAGTIYAPTHPSANATTGCVNTFTFTQGLQIDNGATVNGTLAATNDVTVGGRVTAAEVFVGSGNVGNVPTCTGSNKIQWNGTNWVCVADEIGATAATETDPQVGGLTNGRWCRTNGSQIICDVNAAVTCGTSQKLYWNGSTWSCIADQGLTAESDPQVGTLTSGKWCTSNGSSINCTSDAPSGTTTTTTGASCVNCNSVCGCGGTLTSCSTCNCNNCSGGDDNGDW